MTTQKYHRRSIRLRNYNYATEGMYFVTICIHNRKCLFGEIVNNPHAHMVLNDAGCMIKHNWHKLSNRFPNIEMDEFIIMPNHIHGIISIVGAPLVGAQYVVGTQNETTINHWADTRPAPTLGDIICAFKSITTNEYSRGIKQCNWTPFYGKFWQRNFYEHVVRDENDLNRIRQYIIDNPFNWNNDKENPNNIIKPEMSTNKTRRIII